eukprot:COSAG01_NODE_4534_length_4945_cov_171.303756_1_plen_65_part_00
MTRWCRSRCTRRCATTSTGWCYSADALTPTPVRVWGAENGIDHPSELTEIYLRLYILAIFMIYL